MNLAKYYAFVVLFVSTLSLKADPVQIEVSNTSSQVLFATDVLEKALKQTGFNPRIKDLSGDASSNIPTIRIGLSNNKSMQLFMIKSGITIGAIKPQGYIIKTASVPFANYVIIASDDNGLMYGILQLADYFRMYNYGVKISEERYPYIEKRGIKINIPLDARTPSYDSDGDDVIINMTTMYDVDFWKDYIDELTKCNYNVLSFWNNHPFPSMCRIPEYPNVALGGIISMDSTRLKKDKIKKKIKFWTEVFDYAKGRGFDIYWFNYNVYAYGARYKNGITNDWQDSTLQDYSKEALISFLETYPQIDGFGTGVDDNFESGSANEKERWIRSVWGDALEEYNEDHPQHQVELIHRTEDTDIDAAMSNFSNLKFTPFSFSYPYSKNHLYSSPNPRFYEEDGLVKDLEQYRQKTWLTLKNNDQFYFRWADHEFADRLFKGLPNKELYIKGFFLGSDTYLFGSTHHYKPEYSFYNNRLEVKKHWLNYYIWGKTSYYHSSSNDYISFSNEYFEKLVQAFYPEIDGAALYRAWQKTSQIIPLVNTIICSQNISDWYPEGCFSSDGFIDLDKMAKLTPYAGDKVYSFDEYVAILKTDSTLDKFSPVEKHVN